MLKILEICADAFTQLQTTKIEKPQVFIVFNQNADPQHKSNAQLAIRKARDKFKNNLLLKYIDLTIDQTYCLPNAFPQEVIFID